MDERDPLWELLRQARPSAPDGALASRTLARLAVEKNRRRRWARLAQICAVFLLLAGGGGYAAWLVHRGEGQEAGSTRSALASIDANPSAEEAEWLQEQLSGELGEKGEAVLWEEANSF